MTDLGQGRAVAPASAHPTPSCIRPRQAASERLATGQAADRRATAREALAAALSGVRLGGRDRQFLSRLVHWDKRIASSVASLLWRARLAGREEAALTPRQLEVVIAALGDAAIYRSSGADSMGCWDCENIAAGRCADHAKDADRARNYAELAAMLSGRVQAEASPLPTDISGYRRRTPVAS